MCEQINETKKLVLMLLDLSPPNVNMKRQPEEETVPCLPSEHRDKSHSLLYRSFNEGYNGVSRTSDCEQTAEVKDTKSFPLL